MRTYLPKGTFLQILDDYYEITGLPIGEGGGSIIYPALRLFYKEGTFTRGNLYFAIKEAFPLSQNHDFIRNEEDEIIPADRDRTDSMEFLLSMQEMLLKESFITASIYKKGFRLTPILGGAKEALISKDQGKTFCPVHNTYTVMESLEEKGKSLTAYLKEYHRFSLTQTLRTTEQILLALQEVHAAGYLHLDIQAGNILLKGSLDQASDLATLIDFGSARKINEYGKTEPITDQIIFTTKGYSAPEIVYHNDGSLCLGPEADLYSLGYLMLYLLTGTKPNAAKLYGNTKMLFSSLIPRRRMSALHCPKHLQTTLQHLLFKALAVEPRDRYHSALEMIADVRDLLEALSPYRSDLAGIKYDAFISYRHLPADRAVAAALQTRLEHFHVPKSITEESPMAKKKIERVFMDEGELSSCGDMGAQIREALKNSGHLIVICSKETKDSPWVNLEIDTFLEYHDKSRILAVIIDGGTTKDVYPEQLKNHSKTGNNEALAIYVNGSSIKESLKNLKGDPLLKIAAPIIGTPFDSLKQRRKIYVFKQMAAIFSVVFFALLGFSSYIFWQSTEINKQYLQSQKNQAKSLSKTAMQLYQAGDKERSLLLSLAIQPKDPKDGPLVPDQMLALNTALSTYKIPHSMYYSPACQTEIKMPHNTELSPEESYLVTINQYGQACFIYTATGEPLWTADANSIEEFKGSSFRYALPVTESTALLFSSDQFGYVDIAKKKVLYTADSMGSFQDDADYYSLSGNYLAAATEGINDFITIYDIDQGKIIKNYVLNKDQKDDSEQYTVNYISLDDSQNKIYLGFDSHSPIGAACVDIMTDEFSELSQDNTCVVYPVDNNVLAMIHYEIPKGYDYDIDFLSSASAFWFSVYDLESHQDIYVSNQIASTESYVGATYNSKEKVLCCWLNDKLFIYDIEKQALLKEVPFNSPIINTYILEDLYLTGCSDGYFNATLINNDISKFRLGEITQETTSFLYSQKNHTMIQETENSLVFSNTKGNSDMKTLSFSEFTDESYYVNSIQYFQTASGNYRCAELGQNIFTLNGIVVYSTENDKNWDHPVFQFISPSKSDNIYHDSITIKENDAGTFLAFVCESSSGEIIFYKYNLLTGEELIHSDLSTYENLYLNSSIIYSKDLNWMIVNRANGCVTFDISGKEAEPIGRTILPNHSINSMELLSDNCSLILASSDKDMNNFITIYNVIDKTVVTLDEAIDYVWSVQINAGNSDPIFSIYNQENNTVTVYDALGEIVSRLDLTKKGLDDTLFDISFFDNDEYMILADNNILSMWNIRKNAITMSYEIGTYAGRVLGVSSSTQYFYLKNDGMLEATDSDLGITKDTLTLFYVSEDHQFYPVAKINYGYCDLNTMEICTSTNDDTIYFCTYYSYQELREKALTFLDGRTLTEKEKAQYFLTEDQ